MKDTWMKHLKDQTGDYQKKAPEGLLDDIKKEMSRRDGMSVHKPVRSYKRQAKWWVAAAAVLAVAGVGMVEWIPFGNPSDSQRSATDRAAYSATYESSSDESVASDEVLSSSVAAAGPAFIASAKGHFTSATPTAGGDSTSFTEVPLQQSRADETTVGGISQSEASSSEATSSEMASSEAHQTDAPAKSIITRKSDDRRYAMTSRFSSPKHPVSDDALSFDAWYGGMMGSSSAYRQPVLLASAPMSDAIDDANESVIHEMPDAITEFSAQSLRETAVPTVKAKHYQSIKIGVSVRYQLDKRWSLQTGLTYSYLHSEFTDYQHTYQEVTNQKLHYIGIPFSASYAIWKNRHFTVYATAGVEAEKLVQGKAEHQVNDLGMKSNSDHGDEGNASVWNPTFGFHPTSGMYPISGGVQSWQSLLSEGESSSDMTGNSSPAVTDIREHRLVWSTHAAVGAEYHVSDKLSIYAEPGVSYYFKNGSGVESSYTDKSFLLNLHLGVRLHINR